MFVRKSRSSLLRLTLEVAGHEPLEARTALTRRLHAPAPHVIMSPETAHSNTLVLGALSSPGTRYKVRHHSPDVLVVGRLVRVLHTDGTAEQAALDSRAAPDAHKVPRLHSVLGAPRGHLVRQGGVSVDIL